MPRGFKRNLPDITEMVDYVDGRSFATRTADGQRHEILYGTDWEARKAELWERDGAKCVTCGAPADDPDHVENAVGKRCDCLHNLRCLCRRCHRERHEKIDGRAPRWSSTRVS